MEIIPSEIEKYCKKIGQEIHVGVQTHDKELALWCMAGRYEQHSRLSAILAGSDIDEILELNGITGPGSKVQAIWDNLASGSDKEINDLIYTTLGKYILQMLNAASARILFPEIIPLEKHEADYFKKESVHHE